MTVIERAHRQEAALILRREASETFDMDLDRALRALADQVEADQLAGAVDLLSEACSQLHEAGDLVAGGNVEKDIRALCDRIDAYLGGRTS